MDLISRRPVAGFDRDSYDVVNIAEFGKGSASSTSRCTQEHRPGTVDDMLSEGRNIRGHNKYRNGRREHPSALMLPSGSSGPCSGSLRFHREAASRTGLPCGPFQMIWNDEPHYAGLLMSKEVLVPGNLPLFRHGICLEQRRSHILVEDGRYEAYARKAAEFSGTRTASRLLKSASR